MLQAPSSAFTIWLYNDCDDTGCDSPISVFDIAPSSSVHPCTATNSIFFHAFLVSATNDSFDYAIMLGLFTTHNTQGISYAGSNLYLGTLTESALLGSPVQCSVPPAQATSCEDANSLYASDRYPVAYREW